VLGLQPPLAASAPCAPSLLPLTRYDGYAIIIYLFSSIISPSLRDAENMESLARSKDISALQKRLLG
jgi:hypothetical protein